jgi:peptide/nickel transport system substrate-binding protein
MDRTVARLLDATGISRRDLLRTLGVAGGGIALAGTASGDAFAAGTGEKNDLIRVSQADGDRRELVVGVAGLPAILDPGQGGFFSVVGFRVTQLFFEPLVRIDYRDSDPLGFGNTIVPALAASWTQIDDLTMEIVLREGAHFHDGTPVTAEDVKFTIDRIIAPDADERLRRVGVFYDTVDHVEIIDERTLHIVTKQPDAVLLQRFVVFFVVSKAAVEAAGLDGYALNPIGAGPYKVSELVAADHLTLEAFDDYYDGPVPFSKVTIRMIPEVATRMAALLSDEVQIITDVTPDQTDLLTGDSTVNVISLASVNAPLPYYNTRHATLADKRLRQALNLAIDRQLLIDTLWMGQAQPLQGYQIPEWGPMFNADRPAFAYDPEKAKELIAAAGYDGGEIVLRAPAGYYPLGDDAAQAIVAMWQDVGINARTELYDLSQASTVDPASVTASLTSAAFSPFDPVMTFATLWGANGSFQTNYWTPESPKFNENLDLIGRSLDMAARSAAYQEILDIWEDEAPGTLLYRINFISGQDESIGWQPYTGFDLDLRRQNINPTAE